MNIAFWSNVRHQSGVTSCVALLSVLWSELFSEEVAVTSNHICNYGLMSRLYGETVYEEKVFGGASLLKSVKLPDAEDAKPDFSDWAAQGEAKTRTNLVKSIFLDAAQQEEFNRKLQDKYAKMEEDAMSESYLAEDAELLIVAYGISSRIARTTAETLRAEGVKAGCFRPITLSPFPCKALAAAAKGRKVMVIALDAGQFADDVRLNLAKAGLGQEAAGVELVSRMGGQVVTVDDAVAAAKKAL